MTKAELLTRIHEKMTVNQAVVDAMSELKRLQQAIDANGNTPSQRQQLVKDFADSRQALRILLSEYVVLAVRKDVKSELMKHIEAAEAIVLTWLEVFSEEFQQPYGMIQSMALDCRSTILMEVIKP